MQFAGRCLRPAVGGSARFQASRIEVRDRRVPAVGAPGGYRLELPPEQTLRMQFEAAAWLPAMPGYTAALFRSSAPVMLQKHPYRLFDDCLVRNGYPVPAHHPGP